MNVRLEILPEEFEMILRALDHLHAYTRAVQREDRSYAILRERLADIERFQIRKGLRDIEAKSR
jgi:hypothetical protein